MEGPRGVGPGWVGGSSWEGSDAKGAKRLVHRMSRGTAEGVEEREGRLVVGGDGAAAAPMSRGGLPCMRVPIGTAVARCWGGEAACLLSSRFPEPTGLKPVETWAKEGAGREAQASKLPSPATRPEQPTVGTEAGQASAPRTERVAMGGGALVGEIATVAGAVGLSAARPACAAAGAPSKPKGAGKAEVVAGEEAMSTSTGGVPGGGGGWGIARRWVAGGDGGGP